MSVTAIIGAQYGSEGKGVVAHRIAVERRYNYHVRVGGPNAGHSFTHDGEKYVVQAVPCGFVDKAAALVLGAGAVINPRLLAREVSALEDRGWDIRSRLYIDRNATVLSELNERDENHTHGELHQRIGSTGEGVGAARISRLNRFGDQRTIAKDYEHEFSKLGKVTDTVEMLSGLGGTRSTILLEGTQGSGLSLTHGPWPYCTTADTNAAQICADAGIAPQRCTKVILVARTFPIRVAGNSGPLFGELTWQQMSAQAERKVEERTTVTKKTRRIGEWDPLLFRRAVMLNSPTEVAITFLDYLSPIDYLKTDFEDLAPKSKSFITMVGRAAGCAVTMAGTGVHEEKGWTCVTP